MGRSAQREHAVAEASFGRYLKPVRIYNTLRDRATRNPVFLTRCLSYVSKLRKQKHVRPVANTELHVQVKPAPASQGCARLGFVALCRELADGSDDGVGSFALTSTDGEELEVLQAAKVASRAPVPVSSSCPAGSVVASADDDTWRSAVVFDHPDLGDPALAKKLRVVCVRWQTLDGLGGALGGSTRAPQVPPGAKRTGVMSGFAGAVLAGGAPAGPQGVAANLSSASNTTHRTRLIAHTDGNDGNHHENDSGAKMFGHVPDGATVWTRSARLEVGLSAGFFRESESVEHHLGSSRDAGVPPNTTTTTTTTTVIAMEGSSVDWNVKRCVLSAVGGGDGADGGAASKKGKSHSGSAPPFGEGDTLGTRIALNIAPDDEDDIHGVYDDWLGGDCRAVLVVNGAAGGGNASIRPTPVETGVAGADDPNLKPDPHAKTTRVAFHYLYHRGKLRKAETTTGITCPLCLRDAENFTQLCTHLDANHGRFKFAYFPNGDAAVPPAQNLGRPPAVSGRGGSVGSLGGGSESGGGGSEGDTPGGNPGSNGTASDASTQVEITQVVNSGPAVHVMCREEDENARELVEQDEWEWFHLHGGWYSGSEARRKRFAEKTGVPGVPGGVPPGADANNEAGDPPPNDATPAASLGQVPPGTDAAAAASRKEMLPTYAVKEFVFASRRYPLERMARLAMREAHEAAVLRSKQNRQIEDVALLKAQHRAKRVEAQTARRRREREEAQTKDETALAQQSTEHQRQQLLLMQLSKHREMAIAHAVDLDRRRLGGGAGVGGGDTGPATHNGAFHEHLRNSGMSGMGHLGNVEMYPGFAHGGMPLGFPGSVGGGGQLVNAGVGHLSGVPSAIPGLGNGAGPGAAGFVPHLGYGDGTLARMRLRELEANERLVRLEINRITAARGENGTGGVHGHVGTGGTGGTPNGGVPGIPVGRMPGDHDGGVSAPSSAGFGDSYSHAHAHSHSRSLFGGAPSARYDGGDKRKGVAAGDFASQQQGDQQLSRPAKKSKTTSSVDQIIADINRSMLAQAQAKALVLGSETGASRGAETLTTSGLGLSETTQTHKEQQTPYVRTKPGPKPGAARKKREEEAAAAAAAAALEKSVKAAAAKRLAERAAVDKKDKKTAGAKAFRKNTPKAGGGKSGVADAFPTNQVVGGSIPHGGIGPPGTAYHAKTAAPVVPFLGDADDDGNGNGKNKTRLENVAPKVDSDDEDDALAFAREDYRRVVDFQDIQREEKIFMHEWNLFVAQFAFVGNRELPRALEAFAHHRGDAMSKSKTFKRLFALHLLNAFEFGVVPAATVDTCLLIVDLYGRQAGVGKSIPSVGAAVGIPGMGSFES